MPDVLFAEGGEYRVHDRVYCGVAVRVRDERVRAGDALAEQLDAFARGEFVNIVAEADERGAQIVFYGDLDIFGIAFRDEHLAGCVLVRHGEVVQAVLLAEGVSLFYALAREAGRRLHAAVIRAVEGFRAAVGQPQNIVREGERGDARAAFFRAVYHACDELSRDERARAVVYEYQVALLVQRLQAETHGLGAARAAARESYASVLVEVRGGQTVQKLVRGVRVHGDDDALDFGEGEERFHRFHEHAGRAARFEQLVFFAVTQA